MANKVLVTGGSGFLGRNLVQELSEGDDEVWYTYRTKRLRGAKATPILLDLNEVQQYDACAGELQQITHLVHAAAVVRHDQGNILEDLHDQITCSVEGFSNLLQYLPNLQKVVYISSGSAALCDADPTFYGLGKLLMEGVVSRTADAQHIPYVSLRFPQLFGPGEPHGIFVTRFFQALQEGQKIKLVNDGVVSKDVLYIQDAVGSILQALSGKSTGLYTITMDQSYTVKEVIDELAVALGVMPRIEHVTVDASEIKNKSFHLESSTAALGYELRYNLHQGIKAMVEDMKK
ncbi:MAG TPA: NAD(P)-dependent oxidoreductase [Candidatus Saccharimonadia bacterium]|nr:NAD(P)-dependent oxidoreductase [Candidatus Saccharimonadia bacterium]